MASSVDYIFVDSATVSAYINDNADEKLSQMSYEDQLSDIWSPINTPVSQSDTSLNSGSSQCSSGYCSDSSYVAGSVSKSLPSNKESTSPKRPLSNKSTSPTNSDDKSGSYHSPSTMYPYDCNSCHSPATMYPYDCNSCHSPATMYPSIMQDAELRLQNLLVFSNH